MLTTNQFLSMASYLAGRSVATKEWYKLNITDYPDNRKNFFVNMYVRFPNLSTHHLSFNATIVRID